MELHKCFKSFNKFKKSLEKYEKQVFANFYISHSERLSTESVPLNLREKIKFKRIYLKCKQGGRIQASEDDIRHGNTYKVDCKARINVIYDGKGALKVKKLDEVHNHAQSQQLFNSMPKQRRFNEAEQKELEGMIQLNPDMRLVQVCFEEKRKQQRAPTLKDLYNARQKMNTAPEKSMLEKIVGELCAFDSNIVKIYVNEDNELEGLFYQDDRMRKYFSVYPGVLIADATYKLNDRQMPLMLLLVIDGNGESQIVAFFVIRSENYRVVKKMLKYFKEFNPKTNEIEVILADKSMADRKAFQKCFPQANLQLCIFHVSQSFNREITTRKRKITDEQRDEALSIMNAMIYAATREIYRDLRRKLLALNYGKVNEYFEANWHTCRREWVACYTDQNANLLNRTTNRVESINQKLKSAVTRNGSAPRFIRETLKCIKSLNIERDYRSISSLLRHPTKRFVLDSPEHKYSMLLTAYALKKVLPELNAMDSFVEDSLDTDFLTFQLDKKSASPAVARADDCDCRFFKTIGLPCRHIFKFLKMTNQPLFAAKLCKERWYKEKLPVAQENGYTMIKEKTDKIIQLLSDKPAPMYNAYMNNIDTIISFIRDDVCFNIEPLEDQCEF